MNRIKRRFWYVTGIIFLLLAGVLNIPFYHVLTLQNPIDGQVVFSVPLQPKEPFYIRYIHSINLTPVLEKYYIDDNMDILVDSVTYESYGVGMPSGPEPGQTFTQHDGKFTIGNINRRLPYFDQRIGQVIANHVLIVHNQEIPLAEIRQPGTTVRFKAAKESPVQRFGRGFLKWLDKIDKIILRH